MTMNAITPKDNQRHEPHQRPNFINRLRSRQAGHPRGLLGRIIGRVMVKDTASSNDAALELLDLSRPRVLLEIGFGQGRTVAKLLKAGHEVIGAEFSTTMVAQATARNRKACRAGRARLVHSNGVDIPFADKSADLALTVHTIYFMQDPARTFADVARVLRPGGRFVLATRIGDEPMPAWMDREIYHIPTVDEIEAFFDQAGFDRVTHHPATEASHQTHWFVGELRG